MTSKGRTPSGVNIPVNMFDILSLNMVPFDIETMNTIDFLLFIWKKKNYKKTPQKHNDHKNIEEWVQCKISS